ncbi:MAG: aminotransferase class V-fold PLP-dependent enzyme [Jiangellaceae bacterium]|nr:aminotransferase class V-fold PLP-dependent enzyme [Jiangellaceae bacterium]
MPTTTPTVPSIDLPAALASVSPALDELARGHWPSYRVHDDWRTELDRALPEAGAGADETLRVLAETVAPHGAPFLAPGFSGWIVGAPTAVPIAAGLVTAVGGQQRYLGFSGNVLEEVALRWVADLCGLPSGLPGVLSSGGSVANLLALAAARQRAYERLGQDPSREGLHALPPGRVYASEELHHCFLKAAGALGLGRSAVRLLPTDGRQRLDVGALHRALAADVAAGEVPVAVVGIAGTTNTGAIDPLDGIADAATEYDVWYHIDGAYGLFGVLDPDVAPRFAGLSRADSWVVDMHKWLAVPTGTGATYVRDSAYLGRALTQEPSDYIEGAFANAGVPGGSPWDQIGTPYQEWSLELSAAARGIAVWATLHEVGRDGVRQRVVGHNTLAQHLAERIRHEPALELLHEPELSVCCFRVRGNDDRDADARTDRVLRALHSDGVHVPSGTRVGGRFAIRACFVNPRQTTADADALVDAVVSVALSE